MPLVTRARFDAHTGPIGAIAIGSPEEVDEIIIRLSEALGGISRFTFHMENAGLSYAKLKKAIELVGKRVLPLVNRED